MAASTAPRKNFITRDHRYVYLGGSLIALLGLGMFYSAPSPYSFIPAQSVFGTALAAICWFFLGVSAMALLVKWAYWNNYSSTIMKRPLIVRVSRYLSYLDAAACALLVLDRFILKLAYIINAAIHADSNPTDTLSTMAYMAYNQRSLFAIGISYTVRLALFGTAIAFVLALLMVFLRIQEPDKRDNDFVKFLKIVANKFSRFYIFVIRGTPMMVQLLIMSLVIFASSRNYTMIGILALGINSGAYVSEIVRSGLMSVDPGQMEAGRSLGLNYITNMVGAQNVVQAYVPAIHGKEKRKAQPGKEGLLGVEGMDNATVLAALERAGATFLEEGAPAPDKMALTKADLYALGLSGTPDSAARRAALLRQLQLPPTLSTNRLLEVLNATVTPQQLTALLDTPERSR